MQSHNSSRAAPHGQSEGDFHQEFYPVSNLWVVLCVYCNGYKRVLYVFTLALKYSEYYAVKTSPGTYINVVHKTHTFNTSDNNSSHATPLDTSNIRELSLSDLALLPAKTLHSQLKSYKLSPVGNKTTMDNRFYQFLHPTSASTDIETVPCPPQLSVYLGR